MRYEAKITCFKLIEFLTEKNLPPASERPQPSRDIEFPENSWRTFDFCLSRLKATLVVNMGIKVAESRLIH